MREAVAIVGIGCRFPGGVRDPATFWELLRGGRNAVGEIPPDRIDVERWYDPRPATPGRMATRLGGFLDRIQELDAAFFGISPREAERIDPQQRLLLETAWEAVEDAGEDVHRLAGSATGVFVGQWTSDFEARLFRDAGGVDFYSTTGSGRYAASGRLSYVLGLHGPSLTLDTACSSSLVAVHLAARSVASGECERALAGGVNVILQPHVTLAYSASGMMALDGQCKFGDAAGRGYVRSEGAGVVVLKALDRALEAGDRVYAVIRGSAVQNDGRSSGSMGTPSRPGQERLLRAAYRDAGVAPGQVRYVEAHGTGTRTGDPVELAALAAVLGDAREPSRRALVGSVKTNLGHTEGAAGVAGLIKVALALHHGTIPPSLHFRTPHPDVAWADLPFSIPTAPSPWPPGEGPRVAGVSAFGIAGTNAHVVLEEAPAPRVAEPAEPAERALPPRPALLPLSARSPAALRALAQRHADRLAAPGAPSLRDVCAAAATRRAHLEHRAAFVGDDAAVVVEALRTYADGGPARCEGEVAAGPRPRLAFVVPGQGAQHDDMARALLAREPVFRAAIERCDRAASRHVDFSILEQLEATPGDPARRLHDIDVVQPTLVALALAYAELWRSLGVVPDAVVGHSMGEVGAACIAGALDLDQAMRIVCRRSELMRKASGRGAMALVELSHEECHARINGHAARVSVAVSNSPRSSVVSGDPAAVRELVAELQRDQIFCRLVKVDVASHSPQMAPLAAELRAELSGLAPAAATVPIYSTVLGRRAEGAELGASYWGRNLREPVLFTDAVEALLGDGVTAFVELGPHPVLLPAIQQTAERSRRAITTVATGRRDEPEQATLLAGLGSLWAAGMPVEWSRISPPGGHVDLPLYPWQRERYWAREADLGVSAPARIAAEPRPDDEASRWLYRLDWERSETPAATATTRWIVVADDPSAAAPVAEALRAAASSAVVAVPVSRLAAVLSATPRVDGAVVLAADGAATPYLPVAIVQTVLGSSRRPLPRLWFVTRGAQVVTEARRHRVSVDQAALWGAARVVGEEHPELWGGLVDLDPGVPPELSAALLARHLVAGDAEDQVALRQGLRFGLRLVRAHVDARAPGFTWRRDAAYLITGGLGEAALHVARSMVDGGARRLVLLGRTPLPPRAEWSAIPADSTAGRRVAAVRALEARGAAVHLATVDVGDEAQLRSFLDRYASEGWPVIRGVVHAAGGLESHLASEMDPASFDALVTPKLRGAEHLDRLLPELDLFVCFSSTGAFLAQPGQANYAAANAGLDALSLDRRARGLPALSIGWGVWSGTGLVKGESGSRGVAEMARQGIAAFAPERGAALFAWLCGRAETPVAVLPADWARFAAARRGRNLALFRNVLPAAPGKPGERHGTATRAASPEERRAEIERVVRECVARVLQLAPSRIDARKTLGSYGLTSLLAMELRNRLEAGLGRSLSATLAYNHPTVAAMVDHLAGGDGSATRDPTRPERSEPESKPVLSVKGAAPGVEGDERSEAESKDEQTHALDDLRISELSDEEAARALRTGRTR